MEIRLDELNRQEALRYMGYGGQQPDDLFLRLIDECERQVLECAVPRFIYRVFEIEECEDGVAVVGTDFKLCGNSIKNHLKGCKQAVFFAATISAGIDKCLRIAQITDISKAVVTDSLASVAIEQVCDKFEEIIKAEYPEYYQTFRFGIGYGDLPIEQQGDFLKLLNASKQIGLSASDTSMLIPTKSVTAVIGLSENPIKGQARGCQTCNLKDRCSFRGKGGHCNG
jgi:5-methyltetrahydrofolate--homocysteine methyltransferase